MIDDSLIALKSEASTARLTPAELERLLTCFDPDPDKAALAYLNLHLRLVKLFAWRGVLYAEELADETLNRLARYPNTIENPCALAKGIARMVLSEYEREQRRSVKQRPAMKEPIAEEELKKLDLALAELRPEERDLILGYYQGGQPKAVRQDLCLRFGLSPNALRIRVCRVKEKLLARLVS